MNGASVGGIYYSVDADVSGLLTAEQQVDQSTQNMEGSFDGATDSVKRNEDALKKLNPVTKAVKEETGRLNGTLQNTKKVAALAAAALAFVGVGVGIQSAVNDIANFEQSMLQLRVVSGATEKEMASLEAQARSLGATSMFSAKQAADAQVFLGQAGFATNEILEATPGILQLAAAGGLDLARAADIASNVLGGMRMEVTELNRVNDVLASTAASSNTNIEQLGMALSYAAPIAASSGVEIEELSAAIGVLGDAGLQGSRAGTGIVGVIRQLSNVTSQGQATLKNYGLSLADVDISARGLEPVLETLRSANINTSDAFKLFGSEAGAAAQILFNNSQRVTEFAEDLHDVEGAAADAARVLGSGLMGSMRSLQSAAAESVLIFGDSGLAAAFQNVIDTATGVINILNGMGDQFFEVNEVSEGHRKVMEGLATAIKIFSDAVIIASGVLVGRMVQSLALATAGAISSGAALTSLNGVLLTLRTTLMTLFGPVGLVAGAVTALFLFRKELGLVGDQATNTARRIDALTDSIALMSQTDLQRNLEKARMEMGFLVDQGQNLRRVLERMNPGDTWDGRTYEELQEQFTRVRDDAIHARNGVRELEAALERVSGTAQGTADQFEETETEIIQLDEATKKTKDSTEELDRRYQSLLDRLYPLAAAQRQYREEVELLNLKALTDDALDLEDALRRLERSSKDASEVYGELFNPKAGKKEQTPWEEWIASAESTFTDFDQMNANLAENFTSNFGNAFSDIITQQSSFSDAMKSGILALSSSVISAVGQMIAQWLLYKAVTSSIGGGFGGAGGLFGSAFSGFFDSGGAIQAGRWGIAGENGPEIVRGPAHVTSTKDTARALSTANAGEYSNKERLVVQQAPPQLAVSVCLEQNEARAGEVETNRTEQGEEARIFVADIFGDGERAQALMSRYGLTPVGT